MKVGGVSRADDPWPGDSDVGLHVLLESSRQLSYKTDLCVKTPALDAGGEQPEEAKAEVTSPLKMLLRLAQVVETKRLRDTPERNFRERILRLCGGSWGEWGPPLVPLPLSVCRVLSRRGSSGSQGDRGPSGLCADPRTSLYSAVALPGLHSHSHTVWL